MIESIFALAKAIIDSVSAFHEGGFSIWVVIPLIGAGLTIFFLLVAGPALAQSSAERERTMQWRQRKKKLRDVPLRISRGTGQLGTESLDSSIRDWSNYLYDVICKSLKEWHEFAVLSSIEKFKISNVDFYQNGFFVSGKSDVVAESMNVGFLDQPFSKTLRLYSPYSIILEFDEEGRCCGVEVTGRSNELKSLLPSEYPVYSNSGT